MLGRIPGTPVGDSLEKVGMALRYELKYTPKAFKYFKSKQHKCMK